MQSTPALGSHLSWEVQDEIGWSPCPGAAAVTLGVFTAAAGPPKHPQEPPGTRGADLWFPAAPFPPTQQIFPSFSCNTTQCTFNKHIPTIKF